MTISLEEAARTAIDTYLVPLVERDGGVIALVSAKDDVVVISLTGACQGCPARAITRDAVVMPLLSAELGRPVAVELAD